MVDRPAGRADRRPRGARHLALGPAAVSAYNRRDRRTWHLAGIRDAAAFALDGSPPRFKPANYNSVAFRYWRSGYTRTLNALQPIVQVLS